jgi:hypothetical protein
VALPDPTRVAGPAGVRLTVPTHVAPDGGQTTHPSVVHVPGGWGGYEYWMAHTPYPGGDNQYEDPNICASPDGINWIVPPGLVNPIDDQPGSATGPFNSDVDLRMGPDNTLYLFWRWYDLTGASPGSEERLYYSTSLNGIDWAPKQLVYSSDHTVIRLLSPCFIYEGGTWGMWAVDVLPSPHRVVRLQGGATPTDTWGAPVEVDMGVIPDGKEAWHLGMIRVADGYIALLNDTDFNNRPYGGEDLFCVSADGLTFINSGKTVIPSSLEGEYDYLYRASLIEEAGGWRVWYSAFIDGADQVWNIFRTLLTESVPEPPDPEAPVITVQVRPYMEWIACDTVSGEKIAYMPGTRGTVSRALGAFTSDTLTVPAPLVGNLAMGGLLDQAIGPDELPNRMMVLIVNDTPVWAGLIWKVRGGSAATVELGCATPESYLDRRYIGDVEFAATDQAAIARALITAVNTEGIGLVIDCPDTGTVRDRTYWDDEDATYLQRLTELMDVEDGLEWTIDPEWRTDRKQAVQLVFRGATRLGSAEPRGPLDTDSGAVLDYSVSYDYGKAAGANDVVAYSSGEGTARPQSQHIRNEYALGQGVPRIEHRWSPSSSIKNVTVLNAHAAAELGRLDGGTTTIDITARWDVAPARLGVDLNRGDDIEFRLSGHMHPLGLLGVGRMVGWRLDTAGGTFQPTLRL